MNVLRPRAILALTATAAPRTRNSIGTLLSLTEEQQVVESPLRDNLRLRVMHVSPGASLGGTVAAHMVQLFKSGVWHVQLASHKHAHVIWESA